jgi:hypothetical protein
MNSTIVMPRQYRPATNDTQSNTQTRIPKIIIQLDNKNPQTYKIIYAFDVETVAFLAKKYVTETINQEQAFLICHKELTLLFPITLKKKYDINKYSPYHYSWSINLHTELEFQVAKIRLKQKLKQHKLTPFADLDYLTIKTFNQDWHSANYWLFKIYKTILKPRNFPNLHESFPHRKIISLADGDIASQGTASILAQNLIKCENDISITAANISSKPKDYSSLVFNNVKVDVIDLDNCNSFIDQGIKTKFDLIVMSKGLCFCDITATKQITCGGIILRKHGHLKKLLFNIASIIDSDNPKSIAILTGENTFQMCFWKDEIQEFNIENNNNLIAKAAINKIGCFKGIIVFTRAATLQN